MKQDPSHPQLDPVLIEILQRKNTLLVLSVSIITLLFSALSSHVGFAQTSSGGAGFTMTQMHGADDDDADTPPPARNTDLDTASQALGAASTLQGMIPPPSGGGGNPNAGKAGASVGEAAGAGSKATGAGSKAAGAGSKAAGAGSKAAGAAGEAAASGAGRAAANTAENGKAARRGNSCVQAAFTALQIIQRGISIKSQIDTRDQSCKMIKKLSKKVNTPTPFDGSFGGGSPINLAPAPGSSDSSGGASSPGEIVSEIANGAPLSRFGISESFLQQNATPAERYAMATAGGIGNLLGSIPGMGGFVDRVITDGPVDALGSIIPAQTGAAGSALGAFAKAAAANGIRPGDGGDSPEGEASEEGSEEEVAEGDEGGEEGAMEASAEGEESSEGVGYLAGKIKRGVAGATEGSNLDLDFNALLGKLGVGSTPGGVPKTGSLEFNKQPPGPDVFHKNTDKNLFEIISNRIKVLSTQILEAS